MIMNNIIKIFDTIFTFLIKPFRKEIRFFIVIFVMSSIVDVIGHIQLVSVSKAIFIALHHYVICYFITLFLCLLPRFIVKIYKFVIYLLLVVNLLIDSVCIFKFHFFFNPEIVGIALGTNINEANEFISTFMTSDFVLILLLLFVVFFILYWVLSKIKIIVSKSVCALLLLMVIISILSFIFVQSKNFGIVSITKISTIINIGLPPKLEKFYTNPNIRTVEAVKPKNIVIIIGESFSKSHSSMYGYEKNTNPKLSNLESKGELYKFTNIKSPGLHTIEVFKALMSTYRPEYEDSIKWYKCLTIQEIVRKAGYNQIWISNQSKVGLYDNIVTKYAELCDTLFFVGDYYSRNSKWQTKDYDELLFKPVIEYRNMKKYKNKFFYIHLMGSHCEFNKRYPISFDVFKENDYLGKKENQRKTLAEYDNSVLYNDYVVNEIIKIFSKEEVLIFYFSDHALDIFDSREDYNGHGRYNDIKSFEAGSNIPFMVYVSPKYQARFPDDCERIRNAVNKKFRTDNMIYTIMDVIGVGFEDNDDVERYSLFY